MIRYKKISHKKVRDFFNYRWQSKDVTKSNKKEEEGLENRMRKMIEKWRIYVKVFHS